MFRTRAFGRPVLIDGGGGGGRALCTSPHPNQWGKTHPTRRTHHTRTQRHPHAKPLLLRHLSGAPPWRLQPQSSASTARRATHLVPHIVWEACSDRRRRQGALCTSPHPNQCASKPCHALTNTQDTLRAQTTDTCTPVASTCAERMQRTHTHTGRTHKHHTHMRCDTRTALGHRGSVRKRGGTRVPSTYTRITHQI